MPVPTDEQLREYAEKLPAIYKAILSAYPAVAPGRREGDGLTADSIREHVEEVHPDERSEDVPAGLNQLEERGFLSSAKRWSFYSPTSLGERLIVVLTGHVPAPVGPPPLPVPTWG